MTLNLKTLAARNTSTFQLLDGNDEPLFAPDAQGNPDATKPVRVTVYGPGSKEYQRVQANAQNRLVERMRKRGKAAPSADERLRDQAEQLADLTVAFENLEYDGLQGRDLALAIYGDGSLGFITEQVNKHAADWANFTKASQPT
ncbi:hypothetical protein QTH87_05980 [Variovorax sp. J22P168]|uniref:hypothetical protein n=1 Tax=Variovorax jilinensis TaxID=3053513 RepID=UPI002574A3E6|nr:hypothetical protein [Variovorax sp. J22P168]MDM0011987.1 hypothetical protein [Variovorax sp. J22P168]